MFINQCTEEPFGNKNEMPLEKAASDEIKIERDSGQYTTTVYQVFPGITFLYTAAHIPQIHFTEKQAAASDRLEIIHCREGRSKCSIQGKLCFLSSGDLAIFHINNLSGSLYYPLRHYHGLTIQIDLANAPQCLSRLLDDVNVRPKAIAEKFCGGNGGFIARANPYIEHIFSELYTIPKKIQKGYFKIKTLELLLFLSVWEHRNEFEHRTYTKFQAELAKDISKYMLEHKNEHITLEQLVEKFHMSGAHIKKTFKNVYGVPIRTYIRTKKMESAAYMLEHTDKSILEIANEHGYDNGSKFASAFRAIKGITPSAYRNTVAQNIT